MCQGPAKVNNVKLNVLYTITNMYKILTEQHHYSVYAMCGNYSLTTPITTHEHKHQSYLVQIVHLCYDACNYNKYEHPCLWIN
jgi:hypothetical protein